MSVIDYSWDFTREEFSLDLDFFNEKEQEDKLWQARTGLNHDTLCGAIETIIFMSDRPVTLMKIKSQIDSDLPLRVVHESIARLQEEYEAKHHGIRLMEVAQGYQFRTKATYSKVIQNMFKVSSMQLSPTALEVLAIIAYKQPISKTSVESIRGVDSSHIVRQLMDKRLVRICGRSEEMGRPSLYATTSEFMEVFNLASLDELPSESELHELATASDIGAISDIKSIVQNPDKKVFKFDEFDELEELSASIKEIAADTMFTETLKGLDKKRKTQEGEERKSAFDILEDFVNSSETIEQNKMAILSEVLMSAMEPKSVDVTTSEELLNAPSLEDMLLDDEDEMIIDLELEAQEGDRELPAVELILTEDFDDSQIISLSEELDEALEKSEMLLEEATNIDAQEVIEDETPFIQDTELSEALEFEADELADALDVAFENLMGSDEDFDLAEDNAEKEDQANAEFIQDGMDALDEQQLEAMKAAKDLDIDLDFMSED
jgi:segregation and condensation protein B